VIIALATKRMEDIHGWIELFSRGGGRAMRPTEGDREGLDLASAIGVLQRSSALARVPELRKCAPADGRYIDEIAEEIDRDRKRAGRG
jgi:hypothetical protein